MRDPKEKSGAYRPVVFDKELFEDRANTAHALNKVRIARKLSIHQKPGQAVADSFERDLLLSATKDQKVN